MSSDKNPIFLVTGVFLVLAAFFVISNFVLTKTYVDVLTTKWNMSALFIAALSLGGIGLISASGIAKNGILSVVGFIYAVLSIVVYGYWGYTQSIGLHGFWAFVGFAIFFIVIAGIGLTCVQHNIHKFVSYGYLFANLAFVMWLVNKYVLEEARFDFWVFAGEIIIVIGGAIVFYAMYEGDLDF